MWEVWEGWIRIRQGLDYKGQWSRNGRNSKARIFLGKGFKEISGHTLRVHLLVLPKKELRVFGEVPLISNQAIFPDKGLPGKQSDADEAEGRIDLVLQTGVVLSLCVQAEFRANELHFRFWEEVTGGEPGRVVALEAFLNSSRVPSGVGASCGESVPLPGLCASVPHFCKHKTVV